LKIDIDNISIGDISFMSKIRLILFFITLTAFTESQGQSGSDSMGINLGYPVFSQYLQNGLLINPAYAGSRGALSGFLSYRMQWMGIPDAPVFETVSLNTPMKNDKVGLGIMAQFMQYGFTRSKSIYASYSYIINLRNGRLSFGLKGGADMSNTDYSGISLTDPGDPVFTGSNKSYILPNFGAGVYYYSDKLFAGISVPQFLSYRRTASNSVEPYHSFNNYDFIFSAGALFTLSQFLKFKPSMLINYSLQETKKLVQLDLNGNFILGDLLWLGASWRTTEEVAVGILQVQINPQLMLGFSYDYPAGRMNSYSKGSSEFILRYEFGSRISAANPRYF
jgi:type IX secretion system PorP/SprF family membrane protein